MVTSEAGSVHRSLRGKALALNTVWNVLGQACPLLIAAITIPFLVRSLGSDRFGLLTLVWALIGYFSLFDLGLSRAITKLVAEKLALGQHGECSGLVWPALSLMAALGIGCAVAVYVLAPWLIHSLLHLSGALGHETLRSLYPLALSIPLTTVTTGLRGILEARHEFGAINAVRVFLGIFSFAGPVLVVPFSVDLFPIVTVLLIGRIISFGVYLTFTLRALPELRPVTLHWSSLGPLIRFGGWISLSNLISPVLVYLDRFLIGSLLTITAVAFYTTPFEMVTKLWLLPAAVVGVAYPAFSATAIVDPERVSVLFERSVKWLLVVLFPILLLVVVFGRDFLQFWLGSDFARNSTRVLQWMAAGVFLNSLAQVPYVLLQAGGRPDLPAKLHLVELALYVPAVLHMIRTHGIEGAAIVWTLRLSIEAVLLFIIVGRHVRGALIGKIQLSITLTAVSLMAAGAMLHDVDAKIAFYVVVTASFISLCFLLIFSPQEKAQLRAVLSYVPVKLVYPGR
jgi:O-antigen/teichoic acid export membrane protein